MIKLPTANYLGTCRYGHKVRVETIDGMAKRIIDCPACLTDPAIVAERDAFLAAHRFHATFPLKVEVRRIKGKLSERHECNDKCRDATGATCLCSCAGEQHGANWDRVSA